MLRHLLSIAAVIGALLTTSLRAQAVDVPVQPNVVSINPFGFIFSWYNAEYEHAFNATTSWAASAGYFSIGNDEDDDEKNYTSADLKFRYYPSAEAPSRFSAGISAGYSRVTDEDTPDGGPVEVRKYDALSIGFELGYSWLMGRTRQFYIGTSIGAKRLFLLGEEDEDETFGYPTVRLGIGYAF